MNRPVTPENQSEIYQDYTICRTKQPINVRLKDTVFAAGVYYPDAKVYHVLAPGSVVTVFGAQTLNLTGVNEARSTENTAYRIEGEIQLPIYQRVEETKSRLPNERLQHSNLQLVAPSHCEPDTAFPVNSIVALKRGITYQRISLPKGELFVITSKALTPRGQKLRFQDPINGAMYDVLRVKKKICGFKVKNYSQALVAHKDLERVT